MGNRQIHGGQARLLGQHQDVAIKVIRFAPVLYVTTETDVAGTRFAAPVLRILDQLAGEAIISPITPDGARGIMNRLEAYVDSQSQEAVSDGSATVHE